MSRIWVALLLFIPLFGRIAHSQDSGDLNSLKIPALESGGTSDIGAFAIPKSVFTKEISKQDGQPVVPWTDALKPSADIGLKLKSADGLVFRSANVDQQKLGINLLKDLAANGSGEASFSLGLAYDRGVGVPESKSTAFKYFSEAANSGNANASLALGRAYRDGIGVPIDYAASANWLATSYKAGNSQAAIELARAYQFGLGVKADPSVSESFWRAASETGSAEAYLGLADVVAANATTEGTAELVKPYLEAASLTGDPAGVLANYEVATFTKDIKAQQTAMVQLRTLSERGDSFFTAKLGDAYMSGLSVPVDKHVAYDFYRRSADAGSAYGQARMGALLLENPELDSSMSKASALELLLESADAGQPEALITLASETAAPIDRATRFALASVAGEVGGPAYEARVRELKFSICNEGVDKTCDPVPVYFITNRSVKTEGNSTTFLNRVAPGYKLTFGISSVNIPTTNAVGASEQSGWNYAKSLIGSYFASEPSQEPTVLENKVLPDALGDFLAEAHRQASANGISRAFVYIHGFNNTFDDAVTRMAQLSEQSKYPGVPIILSWASAGSAIGNWSSQDGLSGIAYTNDLLTADTSCAQFRAVLEAVASEFGSDNVMVLGHSMGGKLLYNILAGCPSNAGNWPSDKILDEVVLAAPDIDVEQFTQSVQNVTGLTHSFTLYVSANDMALKASEKLVGNRRRVGQGGDSRLLVQGIKTIDATTVERQTLFTTNHGYVFDTPQVKHDLSDLLHGQSDPNKRICPKEYLGPSGMSYWLIQPGCVN